MLKYMAKIVYKLVQKLTQSSRSLYYPERSYYVPSKLEFAVLSIDNH